MSDNPNIVSREFVLAGTDGKAKAFVVSDSSNYNVGVILNMPSTTTTWAPQTFRVALKTLQDVYEYADAEQKRLNRLRYRRQSVSGEGRKREPRRARAQEG